MPSMSPGLVYAVDVPSAGQTVPRTGFQLSGWVRDGMRPLSVVVARHSGRKVGRTNVPHVRDDVELGSRCGFRMFVEPDRDQPAGAYEIELSASFDDDGPNDVGFGRASCQLSTFDERAQPYGSVSESRFDNVLHRDDVYCVGPPAESYSPEMLGLLFAYIDPHASVLDVGCGAAPFAQPFRESGRHWVGCESREDLVAGHVARGLTTAHVKGDTLPFATASFDFAMCNEVLEHIGDYEPFVAEIARVVRRGACFSVPNVRGIPRLAALGVIPWHLLEASHVNFFSVVSLRELLKRHFSQVDAFEYGAIPSPIAAPDGTPIFNHVFAVAKHN